MIKTFLHKGLRAVFEVGSKADVRPQHASRLACQLRQIDDAGRPDDMNVSG